MLQVLLYYSIIQRSNSYTAGLCAKVNTLRPRQNGRYFADGIFKRIFVNENIWIPITISLKFVPKGSINNIPALVRIMAWRRPGDKPLSEPMVVNSPTHICVTRPQWVKISWTSEKDIWANGNWWSFKANLLWLLLLTWFNFNPR